MLLLGAIEIKVEVADHGVWVKSSFMNNMLQGSGARTLIQLLILPSGMMLLWPTLTQSYHTLLMTVCQSRLTSHEYSS